MEFSFLQNNGTLDKGIRIRRARSSVRRAMTVYAPLGIP
jgi:hypothetical protein